MFKKLTSLIWNGKTPVSAIEVPFTLKFSAFIGILEISGDGEHEIKFASASLICIDESVVLNVDGKLVSKFCNSNSESSS